MTANRIKKVALYQFAHHGYEGASLAQIADEVGIKKASIYAHFKGKDDLFLQVIDEVFQHELFFLIDFLEENGDSTLEDILYHILLQYKQRYEQYDTVKFWLRMMFFPPMHLYEQVMVKVYTYLDQLEKILIAKIDIALSKAEIPAMDAEQAAVSFMCLLDGVLVELLYSGEERFEKRLRAAWYVYWRGITNTNEAKFSLRSHEEEL